MTRDQVRGGLIIVGLAVLATVFFNQSQQIAGIVFGALGLLFIVLMWYFGYTWYRNNLTAISLMPDRQRNALYAGIGALTVAAAMWSLDQFGLISLGGFEVPVVALGLAGGVVALYAWQESKRYYL
jgi:TRAP-type C4-dicarboxylate transport system permease small subunit